MSMTAQGRKRFRRRTWNLSKPHLPKYSSVPELQLLPQGRPQFHCQRCGFTNTLIPLCLWCRWSSQEAEHEFERSMPRARRASAPPRVVFNNGSNPTHVRPHDRKNASASSSSQGGISWALSTRKLFSKRDARCSPAPRVVPPHIAKTHIGAVHEQTEMDLTSEVLRCVQRGTEMEEEGDDEVAKVTKELLPPLFSSTDVQEEVGLPVGLRSPGAMIDFRDPPGHPPSLTIERSKSEPMKTLKSSRRLLIIGLHDSKTPPSENDDHPPLISQYNSPNQKGSGTPSPVAPGPPQHFRTLRRQKPIDAFIPDATAAEPISISLTLHSTPSKRNMKPPSRPNSATRLSKMQFHPQPASTESTDPTTPPLTPIHLPPTSLPAAEPADASPVRLGHPSRPYYTAIRKGGISPSPSRPSSIIGPSAPSSTRPQSYQPPSSFHFGTPTGGANASSTTTARHLSMSAMFVEPSSSPSGAFSAFSVMDVDNENLDGDNASDKDEERPILPPTPMPTRFTFPQGAHPVSDHKAAAAKSASSVQSPQSQSLSSARSKARGSGIGFSMSGETELRMALAAGAASAGVVEDGFRFRETVTPLAADASVLGGQAAGDASAGAGAGVGVFGERGRAMNAAPRKEQRSGSFMGRVRRLRKGLKEILTITSSSSSTKTTSTT